MQQASKNKCVVVEIELSPSVFTSCAGNAVPDLTLCTGASNGIWDTSAITPPAGSPCSDSSNCNIFCSVTLSVLTTASLCLR
jgi:hypothetical protein